MTIMSEIQLRTTVMFKTFTFDFNSIRHIEI